MQRASLPLEGWLFLPATRELSLAAECLLLSNDEFDWNEEEHPCDAEFDLSLKDIPSIAQKLGFTIEGLDTGTIEDVTNWVRQFSNPPPDELQQESFIYYWRFNAFLPSPGAPDPPSPVEIKQRLGREFYDSLGNERKDVACRKRVVKEVLLL